MGVSAVFALDMKGKPIISRDYRGDVPLSCTETFIRHLQDVDSEVRHPNLNPPTRSAAVVQAVCMSAQRRRRSHPSVARPIPRRRAPFHRCHLIVFG